ncbi:MAG: single-stranded DNA-binding protein [Phycisphaerales bacterium]|nr:single-stranded DNA-binding protein [Phycisphaerales bacterium]
MASFNKVILAGNLTRDPQLSMLPSNTPVCEFGMAINRKWRDQRTNEMREDVCFVDLRIFGRRAEVLNQYMSKGRPLLVEGHLRFDQWEGKDGGKRSKLYVVVDSFTFIDSRGGGDGGSRQPSRAAVSSGRSAGGFQDEMPPIDEAPPNSDDIPF